MTASTLDYALMAGASYYSTREDINRLPFPSSSGWERLDPANGLDRTQNDASGFEAAAFIRGNEIVISYAGTYDKSTADKLADANLGAGGLDRQLIEAALYYEKIKTQYPNAQISFTGHSLGGGLAALMAVFFNKTAQTFDAAPFRAAATNSNSIALAAILATNHYTDADLASFNSLSAPVGFLPLYIRGETNVSDISVAGEFLSYTSNGRIAGRRSRINHGATSEDPVGVLHSVALLAAFKQSEAFRQATYQLPFLVHDMFDAALFKNDTDKDVPDLLTHLIRYEFGVPGVEGSKKELLTKFVADAALIAGFANADTSLKQGLMQIAMQSYYNTVSSDGKRFFETADGGVSFDLTGNIGDSAIGLSAIKGYDKLKSAILGRVTGDEANAAISSYLAEAHRMGFVLTSGGGMAAQDDATADFMILGANGGWLDGKGGNDVLVGGNGMDALTGGMGDDTLIGGNGVDSYFYKIGDGNDTIIDSDKQGRVFVSSVDGKTWYDTTHFIQDKDNPGQYKSPDGKITLTKDGNWKLNIDGGGSIDLGSGYKEGDFGIHFTEAAGKVDPIATYLGDQEDDKNDHAMWPNVKDVKGDAAVLMDMGEGDDTAGGGAFNDKLLGGIGDDELRGGYGDDLVIGGVGHDAVFGNKGKDTLIAENEITVVDALAGQDTGATGAQGDKLIGGEGEDTLIGGKGQDVLLGGNGDDLIVGGADNDNIHGDQEYIGTADWNVIRTVKQTDGATIYGYDYINKDGKLYDTGRYEFEDPEIFHIGYLGYAGDQDDELTPFGAFNDTGTGNDVIYAGGGEDRVWAGNGDDWIDGGKDNDLLFGENGSDIVIGGEGNDDVDGDVSGETDGSNHGNDTLLGNAGEDTLRGCGGNDTLFGGDDADKLYGDSTRLSDQYHGNDYLDGGEGDDDLSGQGGNDTLIGGKGVDYLDGGAGNDCLDGGEGGDSLHGEDGNDTLIGGNGADYLDGGAGNDRYELSAGDGQLNAAGETECISDTGGIDTVAIAGSVTSVTQKPGSSDLVIAYGESDYLIVTGGAGGGIENFEVGGETLSYQQFVRRYSTAAISGTDSDGNPYVAGGTGADSLSSQGDNTVFSGGAGDDYITANGSNSTFIYHLGDGRDTVSTSTYYNNATVRFGAGITRDSMNVSVEYGADGNRYLLLDFGDGDLLSIRVEQSSAGVAQFQFEDGTSLSYAELLGQATTLNLAGGDGDDVLTGCAGNDTLAGGAGNDTLIGGGGNDVLEGGRGTDTYVFEAGFGQDTVRSGTGSDVFRFGAGINAADLTLSAAFDGNTAALTIADATGDTITIGNGLTGAIKEVQFADGSTLSLKDLVAAATVVPATVSQNGLTYTLSADNNSSITGSDGTDLISAWGNSDTLGGGNGDDVIYAWGSNSLVMGGVGDDTIYAQGDRDTVVGGIGNNTLIGSGKYLSYILTQGERATIRNLATSGGEVLWLPMDMGLSDFVAVRGGTSLFLFSQDKSTRVVIEGFFSDGADNVSWLLASDRDAPVDLRQWAEEQGKVVADYEVEVAKAEALFNAKLYAGLDGMGKQGRTLGGGVDYSASLLDEEYLRYTFNGVSSQDIEATDGPLTLDSSETNQTEYLTKSKVISVWTPVYEQVWIPGIGFTIQPSTPVDLDKYTGGYDPYGHGSGYGVDSWTITTSGRWADKLVGYKWVEETIPQLFTIAERGFIIQNVTGTAGNDVISVSTASDLYPYSSPFVGTVKLGDGDDYVNLGTTSNNGDWWAIDNFNRAGNSIWGDGLVNPLGEGAFVLAGSGNDTVIGTNGDDVLVAGTGYDVLDGGSGADTYYVPLTGDSTTVIADTGHSFPDWAMAYGGLLPMDTLVLPPGVTVADIKWRVFEDPAYSGYVLELAYGDAIVRMVQKDSDWRDMTEADFASRWSGGDYVYKFYQDVPQSMKEAAIGIDLFRFSDGTVLTRDELMAQATQMTSDVTNANHAPVVANSIADQSATQGQAFSCVLPANAFSDADAIHGDTLSYSITLADGSPLPAWVTFDATTNTLSGTPGNGDIGNLSIKITATDTGGLNTSLTFAVSVANVNDAATLATQIADVTATQGTAFSTIIPVGTFADIDVGDTLTYSAKLSDGSELPSWLTFNASTRILQGTPTTSGTLSIRIIVTDTGGLTASDVFNIDVATGDQLLRGTANADTLTGGAGNDTLYGGDGNDFLFGQGGADTLIGSSGDDYLAGNGGGDSFYGGAGVDTVAFYDSTGGVTVDLAAGTGSGGYAEGAMFTGIEIVDGSVYDDYLYGDAGDNVLNGGGGNDLIQGGLGNNTLVGGDGYDYMVANGGRDSFNGGAGVDTVTFANSTTSVMVLLGSGLGYGGYAEGATFTGIEDVQGSAYSDYLVGDAGDNSLFGNEGNDYLSGGEGNNVLFGGNGDDYLTAGSGADYVSGGDGNDSLTGGWGNDRLSGGAGNDHYYFGRNYANDNVFDYDSIVGNTDVAHFGSDIAADQIWFRHVGNNLEASIIGTSDTLTIQNWYSGSAYHVEQFRTVDGHVLTDSQVESLVQAMAGFAPPASGQTTLPTNYQTALQPVIAANWQ